MAVREFDRTDDEIVCAIGGCNLTGAQTLVAVVKRISQHSASPNEDYFAMMVNHDSGGTARVILEFASGDFGDPAGSVYFESGDSGGNSGSGATVLTTDGWVIVAVSRPAGANQQGRWHLFKAGAWTHGNLSVATLDNAATQASGNVRFGEWQTADRLGARLAVAAEWASNLSDGTIETLDGGNAASWNAVSPAPVGLWEFNQAVVTDPVLDLSATGTADETSRVGTTVVSGDDPASTIYNFTTAATSLLIPRRAERGLRMR